MNRVNIKEFLEKFQKDEAFRNNNGCYHFYDWFCQDKALKNKANILYKKLVAIVKTETAKFNPETTYVLFNNNCPLYGKLYDSFAICDITTGDVLYTITPKCGHTKTEGVSKIYGKDNSFKEPLVSGTWEDVLAFFKGN
jgi:hypothetical protein